MFKRRKVLSLLMSLVMIISMFAGLEISSFAENDIISYLTYEINDSAVSITDCDETISGHIVIPDTIEGYPVTVIGEHAFDNCTELTSVSIPESVFSIGDYAFWGCYNIKQFSVHNGNPFLWNDSYGVLFNKLSNTLIQYPAGSDNMSYTIPEGIQFIGNNAFYGAYNLLDIIIHDSVSNLGEYSIAFCDSLTSVRVPDSVTSIGYGVFYGCDFLTVYGNNKSTVHDYADRNGINFVTLDDDDSGNSTKSIFKFNIGSSWVGEYVDITLSAKNMIGLESADLIFSFDEEFFEFAYMESGDAEIVCSGGQPDTGMITFSFWIKTEASADTDICIIHLLALKAGASEISVTCKSWDGEPETPDDASVKIGLVNKPVINEEESTDIEEDSSDANNDYNNCDYLTYSIIDDEVIITDCDYSIRGDIIIPETIEGYPVTIIGDNTFEYCYNLTGVVLPDSIKEIGAHAFSSCKKLKNVNIPKSVTTLRESTFSGCLSLKEFIIPDNVTDVEMWVFSNCSSLEKVIIPDSITKINDAMFNACFNLKEVTIPDTVTAIGTIAFYQCYSLGSISIPKSVKSLGAMAFGDIPRLKDIYVHNPDIKFIEEYNGEYFGPSIYNVTDIPEGYTLEEYIDLYLELIQAGIDTDFNDLKDLEEYRELMMKFEDITSRESYAVKTALTIHGYDESTAHDYADKNGINFVPFESEEVKPDNDKQDNVEDNTCSRCGEIHDNAISKLFCAIKSFFAKIIDFFANLFN